MLKLEKQTFDKETLKAYKKLRKENPEIIGIQEFFRDYVGETLKKENKSSFEKSDFKVFEGYFENIKQYQEILKKEGLNISIEKTEMFILGQSIEEFKEFIKNEKIKELIEIGIIENIKLFFGEIFFDIRSDIDLLKIINNPIFQEINNLMLNGNVENIELFFGKNGFIKNKNELLDFINNEKYSSIIFLIEVGEMENIKLFFSSDFFDIKNKDDLFDFICSPNFDIIKNLILDGWIKNIKIFFGKDGIIKNKIELLKIINNKKGNNLETLIIYLKIKNIPLIFGKKGIIKNSDDLFDIITGNNYEKIESLISHRTYENLELILGENGIIKNKDDLFDFINSPNYNLILDGEVENIKLFFSKDFFDVKTKDDLLNFINNSDIKNIEYFLHYNNENIKLFFSKDFFDIKNKDDLFNFINNSKYNGIKDIINYGDIENIKLFFSSDFFNIKNKDDLLNFVNNPESKDIEYFIYCKNESIKLFFSSDFFDIKNKDDLFDIINNSDSNSIKELIKYGNTENIKLFFSNDFFDIKNKNDLLNFIKNPNYDKIIYLINYKTNENIKSMFGAEGFIKNIDDLEELLKCGLYTYLLIESNENKIDNLLKIFKNGFTANNLGEKFDLLFPVKSSGSKVFDEIKKTMRIEGDKDIYEILREKTNNYLDNKNLEKQTSGDLELSIYLRYNHTVNYPEIGELIIIFMQEAIKRGLLKSVKGIKILPREKFTFPRDTILDENSRFCNVYGEDFKNELNKNSVPFYLSHSSNQAKGGVAVVSHSMDQEGNHINLGLELEAKFDKVKTNKKTINEAFDILLKIIGELNKNL